MCFNEGADSTFSRNNKIVCNTIYSEPGAAWYGVKLIGGSKGFTVRNNIIVGGLEGALGVAEDSLEGLTSDNNLLFAHEGENLLGELPNDGSEGYSYSAGEWRFEKNLDVNSKLGEEPLFTSVEKDDYRPMPGSPAIGLGADLGEDCATDITGAARAPGGFDAGAYEAAGAAAGVEVESTAGAAEGRTIRVDPQTIWKAVEEAGPGDTVLLADGEYEGQLDIVSVGAEGAPITIKAEGKGAVFKAGSAPHCIQLQGAKWLVIEGVRLEGGRRALIAYNAEDCVLRSLAVSGATYSGIGLSDCARVTVEGCEVSAGEKFGVRVSEGCDGVIIRGNNIHDNGGGGIHIFTSDRRTTVSTNLVIENNVIARDGRGGGAAMNICAIEDSIIRNNLVYKCAAGGICFYGEADMAGGFHNARNKVVGNTVYVEPGEGRTCLKISGGSTDFEVYNNVFYGGLAGAYAVTEDSFEGLKSDNNLIANQGQQVLLGESYGDDAEDYSYEPGAWKFERGLDEHSVFGRAPAFVSIEKDDYRLAVGSPGIDAGADMSAICPTDITGATRPQGAGFDMGAYEAAGASTGAAAGAGSESNHDTETQEETGKEEQEHAAAGAEVESTAAAVKVEPRKLEADPTNVEEMLGQLKPGDTLELADGEYAALTLGLVGEEGAPITIRGKGKVEIKGPDGRIGTGIVIENARHLVIEDLKCTSSATPIAAFS